MLVHDPESTSSVPRATARTPPVQPLLDLTHTSSFEGTLDLLRNEDFDAVVIAASGDLDQDRDALEAITSTAPGCALLARCGHLTEDVTLTMFEIGFEECLGEQADADEVLAVARRAISRHRARRSNDLMASIIRATADTIFSVDRDGLFTSFNSGAERLFGYSAEEVIGRHVSIITSGEQTDEQRQWYRQLIGGKPIFDEWTTRTRSDGSTVQVSVTSSPMFGSDGEFKGICSVMRDVSGLVGARGHLSRQAQLATATRLETMVGNWEYDIPTGTFSASDEMYLLWGASPDAGPISPAALLQVVHPDDVGHLRTAASRWIRSPGTSGQNECRLITPDGETRTLLVRGQHVPGEHGTPGKLLGTVTDVGEQRLQQADEIRVQRQFQTSFRDSPAPMWIADLHGLLTEVNDALCELLGRTRDILVGSAIASFVHPEDQAAVGANTELLDDDGRTSTTGEQRFLHVDGHVVWAIVGVTLIRDADGTPIHMVGHAQDITSRRRREERLRHMADHDPLTGLLNRRGFDRELRRHISRISRYGATGSLLVVDLDNFKQFNDSHGHVAGDNLIATVSRGLHGRLRADDVIGRLGGDEFAVLLPEADREQAESLAEALLDYVRESHPAPVSEQTWELTASIGILTFQGEGPFSKEQAMIAADIAMYSAKGLGRNRVCHHDRTPTDSAQPEIERRPPVTDAE